MTQMIPIRRLSQQFKQFKYLRPACEMYSTSSKSCTIPIQRLTNNFAICSKYNFKPIYLNIHYHQKHTNFGKILPPTCASLLEMQRQFTSKLLIIQQTLMIVMIIMSMTLNHIMFIQYRFTVSQRVKFAVVCSVSACKEREVWESIQCVICKRLEDVGLAGAMFLYVYVCHDEHREGGAVRYIYIYSYLYSLFCLFIYMHVHTFYICLFLLMHVLVCTYVRM